MRKQFFVYIKNRLIIPFHSKQMTIYIFCISMLISYNSTEYFSLKIMSILREEKYNIHGHLSACLMDNVIERKSDWKNFQLLFTESNLTRIRMRCLMRLTCEKKTGCAVPVELIVFLSANSISTLNVRKARTSEAWLKFLVLVLNTNWSVIWNIHNWALDLHETSTCYVWNWILLRKTPQEYREWQARKQSFSLSNSIDQSPTSNCE